jgi:hypothetical protein
MIHKGCKKTSATGAPAVADRTLVDTRNLLPPPDQNQRAERYMLLAEARRLLHLEGKRIGLNYPANFHRTAKCIYYRFGESVNINKTTEHGKSFYTGVVQCGNVYTCPVCAAKIQERRRQEISQAFDYAYNINKKVVMVTFTFPHQNNQALKDLLARQSEAFKKFRSGNVWTKKKNKVGFTGLIRSLETTHGAINGWHPHTHEAWIVNQGVNAENFREWIARRWFKVCQSSGLLPDGFHKFDKFMEHSVQITDWCSNSEYLAKMDDSRHWGADSELAKSNVKQAKGKGCHPFEFLARSSTGDKKARALFLEYAQAMKGKAQIFWSRGLKSKVGVNDYTDEEIAEMTLEPSYVLGQLQKSEWNTIVKHKAQATVLDLAETSGFEGVRFYIQMLEETKIDITKELPTEKHFNQQRIATTNAAAAKEKQVLEKETIVNAIPLKLSTRTKSIADQMVQEIREKQEQLAKKDEHKKPVLSKEECQSNVIDIKQRYLREDHYCKSLLHKSHSPTLVK